MKISLHIDRIVIEGTALTRRERDQLARTLEQELTRQLRQRASGQRGTPAESARPGREAGRRSPLGARIAHELLAALPAAALAGGQPSGLPSASRRQSRRVAT